jgi:uncharacterized protein YabN with tetrapyrrole methylase and pyrophosphatase domain
MSRSHGLADISILGLGIRCPDQTTRETERVLRRCHEVLYVDTGIATGEYLAGLCPKITPLFGHSYVEGQNRVSAYHHMAAKVVEAALDHGPVAFAVHGHPTVFVNAPFLIRDLAGLLGLSFQVLPGISSMACLFAELMIDPGVHGILMYEATDVLLRRRQLLADVPTLIWQVGTLETRLYTERRSKPERLDRFVTALLESYPKNHPVSAVYASLHPLVPTIRYDFALSDLREHAPELHAGFTLYLPPARIRPISDPELYGQLDRPEHLGKITEDP